MILEDLQHIFKPQTEHCTSDAKLFFMLIDGDNAVIERCFYSELEQSLPMFDSFQYIGTNAGIPRFQK